MSESNIPSTEALKILKQEAFVVNSALNNYFTLFANLLLTSGNLRRLSSTQLVTLKKQLGAFNSTTGKWNDE